METVDQMLHEAVLTGVFPGAVCLVKRQETILFFEDYGLANIYTGKKIEKDTLFDLASLTKPLATTLAVMVLQSQDELNLETKLSHIISDFQTTDKAQITIAHLLLHSAGFPSYQPFYLELANIDEELRTQALRSRLVELPLSYKTGDTACYSDIGFMALRWCIEKVTGLRLDVFLHEEVYTPLHIQHLFFSNDRSIMTHEAGVAATELCAWRHCVIEGTAHDENAFAIGGVEGHAGLFGNATAVCDLLTALLLIYHDNWNHLINPRVVQSFFLADKKYKRCYGFDIPASQNSSSGSLFGKKSVGHLGFTGTSFWIDLEKSIQIILLTNRVHPSRRNDQIRQFRPLIHNVIMEKIR